MGTLSSTVLRKYVCFVTSMCVQYSECWCFSGLQEPLLIAFGACCLLGVLCLLVLGLVCLCCLLFSVCCVVWYQYAACGVSFICLLRAWLSPSLSYAILACVSVCVIEQCCTSIAAVNPVSYAASLWLCFACACVYVLSLVSVRCGCVQVFVFNVLGACVCVVLLLHLVCL